MNELSSSSANHPLASELVDFVSGRLDGEREDELTPHVRACTKCSTSLARFRRAADELPATDDVPWDPEIVETAVVPAAALAAVRGADRPSGGPRPGELWRARPPEGGEVTLVLVRAATPAGIRAVPVSFDVELAGADTLIVDAEQSPLGVPLAFHVAVETTLDRAALLDRLGATDIAERLDGVSAGTAVGSALDERIEYRAALADSAAALGQAGDEVLDTELDRWSVIDHRTAHADLFVAMHEALGESHPGARVTPAPVSAAGPAGVTAVASVSELDAFVLVAILDGADGSTRSRVGPRGAAQRSVAQRGVPGRAGCAVHVRRHRSARCRRSNRDAVGSAAATPAESTGRTDRRRARRSSSTRRSARSDASPVRSSTSKLSIRAAWQSTWRRTRSGTSPPRPVPTKSKASAPATNASPATKVTSLVSCKRRSASRTSMSSRSWRTPSDPPADAAQLACLRPPRARLPARCNLRGRAERCGQVVDRRRRALRALRAHSPGQGESGADLAAGRDVRRRSRSSCRAEPCWKSPVRTPPRHADRRRPT